MTWLSGRSSRCKRGCPGSIPGQVSGGSSPVARRSGRGGPRCCVPPWPSWKGARLLNGACAGSNPAGGARQESHVSVVYLVRTPVSHAGKGGSSPPGDAGASAPSPRPDGSQARAFEACCSRFDSWRGGSGVITARFVVCVVHCSRSLPPVLAVFPGASLRSSLSQVRLLAGGLPSPSSRRPRIPDSQSGHGGSNPPGDAAAARLEGRLTSTALNIDVLASVLMASGPTLRRSWFLGSTPSRGSAG
jgi:hypothetical protein